MFLGQTKKCDTIQIPATSLQILYKQGEMHRIGRYHDKALALGILVALLYSSKERKRNRLSRIMKGKKAHAFLLWQLFIYLMILPMVDLLAFILCF